MSKQAPHFGTWEQAVQWLREQPDQQELVLGAYYDDPLPDAAQRYWRSEEWQAIRTLLPAATITAELFTALITGSIRFTQDNRRAASCDKVLPSARPAVISWRRFITLPRSALPAAPVSAIAWVTAAAISSAVIAAGK